MITPFFVSQPHSPKSQVSKITRHRFHSQAKIDFEKHNFIHKNQNKSIRVMTNKSSISNGTSSFSNDKKIHFSCLSPTNAQKNDAKWIGIPEIMRINTLNQHMKFPCRKQKSGEQLLINLLMKSQNRRQHTSFDLKGGTETPQSSKCLKPRLKTKRVKEWLLNKRMRETQVQFKT